MILQREKDYPGKGNLMKGNPKRREKKKKRGGFRKKETVLE